MFQNSNLETMGRPSLSLPTMTAIRIASASLHKDKHLQATGTWELGDETWGQTGRFLMFVLQDSFGS
jgi:hypothetical protein